MTDLIWRLLEALLTFNLTLFGTADDALAGALAYVLGVILDGDDSRLDGLLHLPTELQPALRAIGAMLRYVLEALGVGATRWQ